MSRLAELVAAYDRPIETGRALLLDEMDALGGATAAHALARSADPEERRVAARVMHLLPDAAHVSALEPLVSDPDPRVAAAARRALRGQPRTPEWHETVARLAAADDPQLRAEAAAWQAEGRLP